MAHVSTEVRQYVMERAKHRCEYCLYPQHASFFAFEMEHIVAVKHGGSSSLENLALACPYCNRAKGTDLGSLDPVTGTLTPFFNPRTQTWPEHFRLEGAHIVPVTPEGRVTVTILQLNQSERVGERERLIHLGLFP